MKKIVYLIVSLLLIVGGFGLIAIAPYHIYTLTLTEGVNTKFLKMNSSQKELMDGNFVDIANTAGLDGSENLYSVYHFSNFLLPFPVNHPAYSMIPSIKIEQQQLKLGAIFLDSSNRDLFSFMSERIVPFEMTDGAQKIFNLPYYKNFISKKSNAEVWKDIFSKKLSLPANTGKSFIDSFGVLKEISYSNLVYNLYILYNRHLILPEKIARMSFDEKSSSGLIELKTDNPAEKTEQIFMLNNGLIYSIKINTKMLSPASVAFRANFLRNIKFKSSSADSAVALYAEYKNISYKNRIDQLGMVYLYLAWSHDLLNPNFMRVIITFLERGKDNYKFLQPFYAYSFKKFGTNFSGNKNSIEETADVQLKRKMSDELEEELAKNEKDKAARFEGDLTTPDEKIKYFLKKSKENQKDNNDDNKDNTLSIE
jgi:hypothetical protein